MWPLSSLPSGFRRALYRLSGGARLNGLDNEQSFRAFHVLLILALLWSGTMLSWIIPGFVVRKTAAAVLIAAFAGAAFASLTLLRRRLARPSAMVFIGVLWMVFEAVTALSGAVRTGGAYRSLILALDAGWLLGSGSAIFLASATLFLSLIEAVLDYSGHPLPVYFPGAAIPFWAGEVAVAVMALGPLILFLEAIRRRVAELKESEDRFRDLSDVSFEGVMIHDNGVILDSNRVFAGMFGFESPDALRGVDSIEKMLPPESRERVKQRIERDQKGPIELTGVRKDGSTFEMETETRVIQYRGRSARLVTVRDITQRRREERERARLQAELHQAHKMESIGRLAGGVAHDFNNLLTVINGYAEMLASKSQGAERRYAEQIARAGASAAALTQQLLSFSRMEPMQGAPTRLNDLIAESGEMLSRLLGSHIAMESRLTASPDCVFADPNQLRTCLMNLAANARDAMPGGGRLTIETSNYTASEGDSAAAPDRYIRWSVRDTGAGMDAETRERIFEPFFTTKDKGRGTGLGLATVYGVATRWKGFVRVVSEPEKGSEFSVYLPLCPIEPDARPAGAEVVLTDRQPGARVLVVEDQDDVRGYVAESLRMLGYAVVEANNGASALDILRLDESIHLAISDIVMPGMQGWEFVERAREIRPRMKALLMTGYTDRPHDARPADCEILLKPFTPDELESRVRGALHPQRT